MKKRFVYIVIIMLSVLASICGYATSYTVLANVSPVCVLSSNDYRLDNNYLDYYAIDQSHFVCTNNGGELESNKLKYAFDRNYSTSFKSAQDNNVSYVDSEGVIQLNFINYIDVVFDQNVTIDRVLYTSETGTTRGYPTSLNIYALIDNELVLIKNYNSAETTDFVLFSFDNKITTNKIRFEYVKVSTKHKYVATAREIMFLQPEDDVFDTYNNLFIDYCQTTLNTNCNTYEKVCELEKKLQTNPNFSNSSEYITRAKMVALNYITYDKNNEFCTGNDKNNVINRYGDIAKYCRQNLQMSSFGTNRQVTGILSYAGDKVTIYVDALPSDPLPSIRFSQHMGSWRSWLGGELRLNRGKNTFTTPNFKFSDYSIDVPLGGAIYIVNPYTEMEQSGNVKVYIEGGEHYPVLNKNINATEFKQQLSDYADKVNDSDGSVIDMLEIVSDHMIASVNATYANSIYSTLNTLDAVNKLDKYMDALLSFGGVTQDEADTLYNTKNSHVNVNIRLVQPWPGAAAFAYTEHIGIYTSWQEVLICGSGFGWGISHEIGHMVDNTNCIIGECTNNMYAKYNETVLEGIAKRGDFDKTTNALTSDTTYNSIDYFNSNRYNFLIWWYLETYQHGFYAELLNCYRGISPKYLAFVNSDADIINKINTLEKTEKQVLLSSIAMGIDLSYYYDRWGYSITGGENDPVFKIVSCSNTFKELIQKAVNNGYINNTIKPKLWYQKNDAYNADKNSIYSNADEIDKVAVTKAGDGYNIYINNNAKTSHLGYEIYEGNETDGYKVIGFTYTNNYVDKNWYVNGYEPKYKIVAVDNSFNSTRISDEFSATNNIKNVCKINDKYYVSLLDAINNANENDVIELLCSFDTTNVVVNKTLTIKVNDSLNEDVSINRIQEGNLFTISNNAKLQFIGRNNAKIILNGNNFSQNGVLISCGGIMECEYVVFNNNNNIFSGSAITLLSNSKNNKLTYCEIYNNTANIGSAIYIDFANANCVISNSNIYNNSSRQEGVVYSKGTLTISNTKLYNNVANTSVIKNYAGGILYIDSVEIFDNQTNNKTIDIDGYTSISNSKIYNNCATINYAGIYYNTSVVVRKLIINNTDIYNNLCGVDVTQSIYVGGGNANICANIKGDINVGGNVQINSDSNIIGNMIINGGKLTLLNGLFENIHLCKFVITKIDNNTPILYANNYTFVQSDLSKIVIDGKVKSSILDNAVIISPQSVTLKINVNDKQYLFTYDYATTVSLNFDLLDTQYVCKYVTTGKSYNYNDKIILVDDLEFDTVLSDKFVIKIINGSEIANKYYLPNAVYQLPKIVRPQLIIEKYICDSNVINADTNLVAIKSGEYVAINERTFKVNIFDGDTNIHAGYYKYGETIDLISLCGDDSIDGFRRKDNNLYVKNLVVDNDVELIVCRDHHSSNDNKIFYILIPITILVVLFVAIAVFVILVLRKQKRR